jgi:hypothetical protein
MMRTEQLRDTQYWRERAEKARVLAEQMEPTLKQRMLEVAGGYDHLATRATERKAEPDPS